MAANESVNSYTDVESVVNRWVVDYYSSLALEFFQKEQYDDFCEIRDVLDSVLDRPFLLSDAMQTKMAVLQFLSRINEGENPRTSFDADLSISPLESALTLLGRIGQECSIPPQDFENVCSSLKEMIVRIFIKNNKFDEAKEVVNRHFPKPMVGKKAIFMSLIRQKSNTHEVIEQINFKQFKDEMWAFCQRLCPFNVPFLHEAAKQLADRLAETGNKAAEPNEQDEPGPSSSPQMNTAQVVPCKHAIIHRTRLEAAYKALSSVQRTFSQLEEEVEVETTKTKDLCLRLSPSPEIVTEQDSKQDALFQRDSGSPMEASPADQPPQTDADPQAQAGSLSKMPTVRKNRQLYTVARLVVEPDSQVSLQCTAASQQLEAEVRTEDPPQSPVRSSNQPQSPVTDNEVSLPTNPRASTCLIGADSKEEPSGSVANRRKRNASNSSLSRNSTTSQQSSSDSEDLLETLAPCKTPVRRPRKKLTSVTLSKNLDNADEIHITDSSLDSSPNQLPLHPLLPQTSSTPHKDSAQDRSPSHSKWKQLYNNAKESKDTWSDEETYFNAQKKSRPHNESPTSISGQRKRMWSQNETKKLIEGVNKFGEGNWNKIKAFYSFKDRTNVNLKDRWRTIKKLGLHG